MNPRLTLALGLSFTGAIIYGVGIMAPIMADEEKDVVLNALEHNIDADLRAVVDAEIKRRGLTPPAP